MFTYKIVEPALRYELSDDQNAIQDLMRRVAREKVAARADEIDRTRRVPAGHVRAAEGPRAVRPALPGRLRRHRQHALGLHRGRGVRPRLLQHRLPAGRAVDAFRRHLRRRHRGAEAAPAAGPGQRRAARRAVADRAAERLRRVRHQDHGAPHGRRLRAQRRQDLVHQRRRRGLHPGRGQDPGAAAASRWASTCSSSTRARRA